MVLRHIFAAFREGSESPQTISSEELTLKHEILMHVMGLSFEPVAGKRATMFSENEVVPDLQIRLNINNRKQFLQFLQQVDKEQVETFGLDQPLSAFSTMLTNQLADHYDLHNPTDEALQLVVSLDHITHEYKRLGLEKTSEVLGAYAHHMKQKSLREYVLLNQSGLMQKPAEGFGPGDWHRDMTIERYITKWNRAIDTLKYIQANPNARPLFEELYNHLNLCISHARATIDQTNMVDEKDLIEETLRSLEKELSKFEV